MHSIAINAKRLFESVVDGIMMIDTNGAIKAVNPAVYRLFGYNEGELMGKNVSIIMPSPHQKKHDGYIKKYLRTGKAQIIGIGRDVLAKKKDGSLFYVRLAVSQVEENGKILFIGIIQDVTEIKEAEEEIKQLNAELEQKVKQRTNDLAEAVKQLSASNVSLAKEIEERKKIENALRQSEQRLKQSLAKERELNEMKGRFLSMASHEFRTPLSTILSSADIIEAYTDTESQPNRLKHTKRIKSAVNNLNLILNDFLSSARLESGKYKLSPSSFNACNLLEEVIASAEGYLKDGQKISYECKMETAETLITTDRHFLENVFNNLLSNAVKYSGKGQPIECKIVINQALEISIKDYGIGIPKNEQAFLFSRFFRASNVENTKGTGLGLSITKQYIELLDGEISLKSEEGKGTVVWFKIPLMK